MKKHEKKEGSKEMMMEYGNKMQGKGWEIHEPEKTIEENLKIFEYIHELYKLEHPNPKPTAEHFPTEIQISSNA